MIDPETMREVPRDGETIGEVMFRGNIVMKGYLKNEKATAEAFAGGWFHTGDLGVLDEHGYVIIKDRSKDIIISGGENISSVEVEDVLYRHPAVLFAAVVAKPDSKWGEVPCAFVELKDNARATEAEIIAFCRGHMSGFKTPKAVVFGPIPKTSTGKIQKFLLRSQVDSAKAISAYCVPDGRSPDGAQCFVATSSHAAKTRIGSPRVTPSACPRINSAQSGVAMRGRGIYCSPPRHKVIGLPFSRADEPAARERKHHGGKIICDATRAGGDGRIADLFDRSARSCCRGARRGQGADVGSADFGVGRNCSAIRARDRKQTQDRLQPDRRYQETHDCGRDRRRRHPVATGDGRPSEAGQVCAGQRRECCGYTGCGGGTRGCGKSRTSVRSTP